MDKDSISGGHEPATENWQPGDFWLGCSSRCIMGRMAPGTPVLDTRPFRQSFWENRIPVIFHAGNGYGEAKSGPADGIILHPDPAVVGLND